MSDEERRFRSLIQLTSDFVWELDRHFVFVYANPRIKDLIGYEPEEILGKTPFDLMPPEEAERIRALGRELSESPRPLSGVEVTYVHKNGGQVILEMSSVPLLSKEGELLGFQGIGRDITQRKRIEEELAKERSTVDKIISLNPYSIGVFDKDGHILRWNRAFLDLVKTPPPRDYSIFDDPLLQQAGFQEEVLKLKEGKTCILPQMWYNTHDIDPAYPDNPVCIKIVSFPVMDATGDLDFAVTLSEDVTQQERTREALRKSEAQFRAIFESSNDCILILDRDHNYLYANQAAIDQVGATRENVVGRNLRDGLQHIPDFMQLWMSRIDRVFDTGEPFREEDSGMVAGRFVHSESKLIPIQDDDGKIVAAGVVYRDVTDRKRADEALRAEQRHLKRLLEMHERDRKLVAYEIHDGLAQSLVGAKMLLEATAQSIDSLLAEADRQNYRKGLDLLGKAAMQARELIRGQRPLILDEQGLVAAIESLLSEIPNNDMRVQFTHDIRPDRLTPPLEIAVFRIVQESFTNARRHSQSESFHIALTESEGRLYVEVEDRGIGFDVENVVEKGFGLEGIRERARVFGGSVTIESSPGEGTRIAVELPLAEPE